MAEATATGTTEQLWTLVHGERDRLGDVLNQLTEAEWLMPSLCAGWRVRDVVAHCIATQLSTPPAFLRHFAAAGFRFHVMNGRNVARHRGSSTSELLAQYRGSAHRTTAPPGPRVTWLAEAVIHGHDIARPTGRTLETSPAALAMVADYAIRTTSLLHGSQRSEGIRLRASDIDWTAGSGPEVVGPAASLIMAVVGRGAALSDLSGDGVETLRSRV